MAQALQLEPRAECGAQRSGGGAHQAELLGPPALPLPRAQIERADALRPAQQWNADAVAQVAGRRAPQPACAPWIDRAAGAEGVQRYAVTVERRLQLIERALHRGRLVRGRQQRFAGLPQRARGATTLDGGRHGR
jgi:hypothetical protein